jgi:hypothetical protein
MPVLESQFPPPLTRAQSAARRREDARMQDSHPGCYVAYLDEWNGDVLNRQVLLVATTPADFHAKMSCLDLGLRKKVQLTRIPGSDWSPVPDLDLR